MISSSSPPDEGPDATQTENGIPRGGLSDVEKNALAQPPPQPSAPGRPDHGPGAYEQYQPRSVKFWLTLLCNFLALFLVALDRTIIATAIPRITDEFHSLGDIGWYGSAYMLTTSASQLVYGRIYKLYDMKRTFLASIVIFEIGSAICGAAPSSAVFIVGRAIAGLGSAGIFSGCMLIMIPMIPLHKRPVFQSIFGMVFGLASVMGPLIGGGFTDGLTWRWCFWINLPIGGVALGFMCLFWNPPPPPPPPPPQTQPNKQGGGIRGHFLRLDPLGIALLLPSTVCLLLALQWGGSTYAWSNWRIILLFVLFVVVGAGFVAVQILMPETATVPARVVAQRSVAFAAGYMFFQSGAMLMLVYYLPIWFQTVKQVSALRSGIYTIPLVLSLVLAGIVSGGITQKLGYYVPAMLIGPSLLAVGGGLMSTLSIGSSAGHWIGYQILGGSGIGWGMQTSGLAIQTVLPREDVPAGIAVNFFAQQLGGAVFTSVGQTILTNLLAARLGDTVPGLDTGAGGVAGAGATDLAASVSPQDLGLVLDAYNYACQRIFLAAMGLAFAALLCGAGMEWRSIKEGKSGQARRMPGEKMADGSAGLVAAQEKRDVENESSSEPESVPTAPYPIGSAKNEGHSTESSGSDSITGDDQRRHEDQDGGSS